jgi:hypothetical protein
MHPGPIFFKKNGQNLRQIRMSQLAADITALATVSDLRQRKQESRALELCQRVLKQCPDHFTARELVRSCTDPPAWITFSSSTHDLHRSSTECSNYIVQQALPYSSGARDRCQIRTASCHCCGSQNSLLHELLIVFMLISQGVTVGSVSDIQRLYILAQAQAGLAMDLNYHGDRYPGAVLTTAEREEARNVALDVLQARQILLSLAPFLF